LIHWSRVPYLDAAQVGDHKVIWELNRHQYFVVLGQAYWLSGDEQHARTFVAHLTDWMDANPPSIGINWASSLEVAFRAISWLWAFQYFRESPALTPEIFRRMVAFLYQHGRHIERYLSTYFSPNTHLTGEALGLFYLGLLLPELRRAGHWRAVGQEILEREITRQVLDDGVYFEQATYYQRYTADFYLHFLILADANNLPIQRTTRRRIEALLDHLMFIQRPDGRSPLIGDDDGGRLVTLADTEPNDFRGTLATAAAVLERPEYCFVAGSPGPEVTWLLGIAGVERFARLPKSIPDQTSRAFLDGGYFIMRDGWGEQADYMILDCGIHGSDTGGHAHADALSFELAAQGQATLIDPGTYTYTSEPRWREYFRSSAAHNSVTVDGMSSSVSTGPFRWGAVAQATVHAWKTHPQFDFFEGSHDGFQRIDQAARHTRSVLFVKGMGWIMRDRVNSAGSHAVGVHFRCAPGLQGVRTTDSTLLIEGPGTGLLLAVFSKDGALVQSDGWVAPVYGKRVQAPAFTFLLPEGSGSDVITVLVSCRHDPQRYRVEELECRGGSALHVKGPEGHHDILIGDGEMMATPQIETDAAWASIRREPNGAPVEFFMLSGSTLSIDGAEVARESHSHEYVTGHWAEGQWRVETCTSNEGS
jgi:hypothetical protein